MMKTTQTLMILLAATALLLAACQPQAGSPVSIPTTPTIASPVEPDPTVTPVPTQTVEPNLGGDVAAEAARQALASQLGIQVEEIRIEQVNAAEWADACLGLATQEEMCAQVITPGFEGTLSANDKLYSFRSDTSGESLRFLPQAVMAAQQALAQMLNISVDEVNVQSFEAVDWTDACLGTGGIAELCLQVITPGYRVVLEAGGKEYRFHTDAAGEIVRNAQPDFPRSLPTP